MRVGKSDSSGRRDIYDGQMTMQDVETVGSTVTTTNYTLGARGADAVSKTDSSGTSVGYPIYDGHGNRAATLTKSGASFSLTDIRTYDAWGDVRGGAQTGRPRARYCANLGHVQDDESGLVYMRARYYEPSSGRFVSEDPAREGRNWLSYCAGDPVNYSDRSGQSPKAEFLAWLIGDLLFGRILKLVPCDSPAWKAAMAIIDDVTSGIAALKAIVAAGALGDAKVRAAAVGLATIATVAFFAMAYHQFCCLYFILLFDEDDPQLGPLHQVGEDQAGFGT